MSRNIITKFLVVMCMILCVTNLNAQISLTKPTTTEKEKDDSKKKKKSKVAKQKGSSDISNRFYLGFYGSNRRGMETTFLDGYEIFRKESSYGVELGYYFRRFGIKAKVKLKDYSETPTYKIGINYLFGSSFELGGGLAVKTFKTDFIDLDGQNFRTFIYENKLGADCELALRIAKRLRLSGGATMYFITDDEVQAKENLVELNIGIGFLF